MVYITWDKSCRHICFVGRGGGGGVRAYILLKPNPAMYTQNVALSEQRDLKRCIGKSAFAGHAMCHASGQDD